MKIVPMTTSDAKKFIALHHRHNKAPLSALFSLGLEHEGMIVGVATVGRPVSRVLDDGWTAEVTRTCTTVDAPKGAVSKLYNACRKAAAALGYRKCITYTLESESGASLRGAGWEQTEFLKARSGWDCPARRRGIGTADRVSKIRWEIVCGKVAHGDHPGGPLDHGDIEIEDAGKGLLMMRCFERGE